MGPGAVLRCCHGVESVEALHSCPGVAASGFSFARAPGISGARWWLLGCSPRDKLAGETKWRANSKAGKEGDAAQDRHSV